MALGVRGVQHMAPCTHIHIFIHTQSGRGKEIHPLSILNSFLNNNPPPQHFTVGVCGDAFGSHPNISTLFQNFCGLFSCNFANLQFGLPCSFWRKGQFPSHACMKTVFLQTFSDCTVMNISISYAYRDL